MGIFKGGKGSRRAASHAKRGGKTRTGGTTVGSSGRRAAVEQDARSGAHRGGGRPGRWGIMSGRYDR